MNSRRVFGLITVGLVLATSAAVVVTQRTLATTAQPGAQGGGVTLLPNGWRIAPAGRHLSIGDLPLAMVLSPDGHSLVVTNNGYQKPTLRVLDLDREALEIRGDSRGAGVRRVWRGWGCSVGRGRGRGRGS